tara:strand:- start:4434 stop:5168 length:735 start_codon:yes stop_codon:yes gene_type:complete
MYSFSEYQSLDEGKKKGLWANIHAKRKRGERPARPGEKDYPKTLNVEEVEQVEEGKSSRPMGVMHHFARGVKQKRGAKSNEGDGKYVRMQTTKKQNKKSADADAHREKQKNERGLTMYPEGYAPGDVDQKVGAVTSIPKKEQEAARKRLLAKAAAKRKSKESKCEEVEHINEEEYDRMRDRKLERYGSGYRSAGNRRYTARSGGTQPKPMPKKKDGPSALDIVKGEIEKKYGKGAIMDTSKKKK